MASSLEYRSEDTHVTRGGYRVSVVNIGDRRVNNVTLAEHNLDKFLDARRLDRFIEGRDTISVIFDYRRPREKVRDRFRGVYAFPYNQTTDFRMTLLKVSSAVAISNIQEGVVYFDVPAYEKWVPRKYRPREYEGTLKHEITHLAQDEEWLKNEVGVEKAAQYVLVRPLAWLSNIAFLYGAYNVAMDYSSGWQVGAPYYIGDFWPFLAGVAARVASSRFYQNNPIESHARSSERSSQKIFRTYPELRRVG